jgi:hypothetical protein
MITSKARSFDRQTFLEREFREKANDANSLKIFAQFVSFAFFALKILDFLQ